MGIVKRKRIDESERPASAPASMRLIETAIDPCPAHGSSPDEFQRGKKHDFNSLSCTLSKSKLITAGRAASKRAANCPNAWR